MAGKENKVQFNLKNVHYAMLISDGPNVPAVFDMPVPIPGAVSLALNQVGELKKFFADGIIYWQGTSNNGYEGDLEIARIPEKMQEDVWGMTKTTTDNVIIENVADKQRPFALLFQIDGDEDDQLYCMYNNSASRPAIEAKTNENGPEPQPQKLAISSAPLQNGDIKASTAADTTEEVRNNWFKSVYQKQAA